MRKALVCLTLIACCRSVGIGANAVVGGARKTTVYAPESYRDDVPIPLVLLVHAANVNNTWQEGYMKLTPLAKSRGFLYAYPNGTLSPGGLSGWNPGEFGNFWNHTADDTAYLEGIVDEIKELYTVDPDRVYIVGHSSGALMAYKLACNRPGTIAAIAAWAGSVLPDPIEICPTTDSVHVLIINGTQDRWNGYCGGSEFMPDFLEDNPGAPANTEKWAVYNGCTLYVEDAVCPPDSGDAEEWFDLVGDDRNETWSRRYTDGCRPGGSAELWTMEGIGHAPEFLKGPITPYGPTTNLAISIVDWLLAHPKRPAPHASFTVQPEGDSTPLEVTFDGRLSTAPEETDVTRYVWDLGDGARAEGVTVKHTYAAAGEYEIGLHVMTGDQRVSQVAKRRLTVRFDDQPIPPWTSDNIGEPPILGGARMEEGDCLLVSGAEGSLRGRSDVFHFAHQRVRGDFRMTARIVDWQVENYSSSLALMVREGLDADARHGSVVLDKMVADFRHRFLSRETQAGFARSRSGDTVDHLNLWLRLERHGDVVSGMLSLDGETWTDSETVELTDLPPEVHVGVASAYSPYVAGGPASLATLCDLELTPLPSPAFVRGDGNDDGVVDISDPVATLGFLFLGTAGFDCPDAADADDSGVLDISDAVYSLSFLFLGGPPPPAPFDACGVDPVTDELACGSFVSCDGMEE